MNMIRLEVLDAVEETPDSMRFILAPVEPRVLDYRAGQFLTLVFQFPHAELRRAYSMASTPGIDENIEILVKAIPNGEVSRWMHTHLKKGEIISSLPPAGRFTLDTDATFRRTIFFIAAGSGITPIIALVKQLLQDEPKSRAILIYQNNAERSTIFRDRLHLFQSQFPDQFVWINLLSNPEDHQQAPVKLNNAMLEDLVYRHGFDNQTLFYTCGPNSFMRMASFTLHFMGIQENRIKREMFTFDAIARPPLMDDTVHKLKIHFRGKTFDIKTSYPTNILDAALHHNIALPYSCRGGRCSTCIARILSGKIIMSLNEVLTDNDLQKNLVLTCVGYAASDVEIEI